MRDIYDEKEIKASDPVPQSEVADDLAQDVTWNLNFGHLTKWNGTRPHETPPRSRTFLCI